MKQATKRLVSMVIVLVLLLASFIIFVDLIKPAYDDAQQARSEVISRETFVNNQQAAVAQVQQLIQSYQSQADVQNSVNQALPNTPDFAGALNQINGIAAANAISLQTFTVSAPLLSVAAPTADTTDASSTPTVNLIKPLGVLTFQVKFNGRYEDMKNFLTDVENNIRIFDVQNISVQPAVANKPGQDLYSVDISIVTYYQVK